MMNTQANKTKHNLNKYNSNKRNANHTQRRWQRGNTLVPVVIGLAIAATATVGFLNQGQELTAKSLTVLASSEITGILSDWNLSETANGAANVAAAIPAMGGNNVYGDGMTFTVAAVGNENSATLDYPTDDATSCGTLAAIFNNTIDGVEASVCDGADNTNLELTLTGSAAPAAD